VSTEAHERTRAAAVAAARDSYGRLLSWLAWQWRDLAAAEDALAEAFATALVCWPRDGVPDSPEGWLMTAAKRNLLKVARRRRQAEDPTLTVLFTTADEAAPPPVAVPDNRLRLMFVCAHPAIDATVRSALMLQTVLGLDAARIAQAFVVSSEAMTKRLVRAKAKIKLAGIRFEPPEADDLPARVGAVLDAIYGAYTLHWGQSEQRPAQALADEALFLAELVAAQLPADAEAIGLLGLLLLCEARRPAQIDGEGEFVPLDQQDPARWDAARIERAHGLIARAAALQDPGPFQIEAAIQAAHCHRRHGGATPWADIVVLYERLVEWHPSIGARIGHAVAVAQTDRGPSVGLQLLDAIGPMAMQKHQPWWAARAHLLAGVPSRQAEAIDACDHALKLTNEPALQRHLTKRLNALRGPLH
jgi:RNA polymerase sigma-70 factor (ECF subfamily)